jgi:ubiquinone biosynthesis protein
MLPQKLVPTRLLHPSERAAPRIAPPQKPRRYRGWYVFHRSLVILLHAVWLKVTFRPARRVFAREIRRLLEELGGVWIQIGKTLALRGDLLSPEVCAELARIQDVSAATPIDAVRAVIREDWGRSSEQQFDEFDATPFAVNSVSQLHRARLADEDVWVAVKVQHPYARETYDRDIRLVRRIVRLLNAFSVMPNVRWGNLLEEIAEVMTRELDFRYEKSRLIDLKPQLRRHGVYVPKVLSELCSRRVLVTEFIAAALMSDYIRLRASDPQRLAAWREENGIDPRKVAWRLFQSVFRQVFEDNSFHADLVPENVVLLRDGWIAFIDCRNIGSLEIEDLQKHRMFFQAIGSREYTTATEISFLLASTLPRTDLLQVKSEMIRILRSWEMRTFVAEFPLEQKSLTRLLDELHVVVFHHGFEVRWSVSRLNRTLANLDASLVHLAPRINVRSWLRRYFRLAARRSLRASVREAPRQAPRRLFVLRNVPERLSELSLFYRAIIRRRARQYEMTTSKAAYVLAALCNTLALGWAIALAFMTAVFLTQQSQLDIRPILGEQISRAVAAVPPLNVWLTVAIILTLFYLYLTARALKRRLQTTNEVEPRPGIEA